MKKYIIFLLVVCLCIPLFAVGGIAASGESGQKIDSEVYIVDQIIVDFDIVIDTDDYQDGEIKDFFGVEIIKIKALFTDELIDAVENGADGRVFSYCITIPDPSKMQEAIDILSKSEHTLNVFQNFYTGISVEYIPETGDINGNGRVDMNDYILLKRHHFATYELSMEQKQVCDLNRNGWIDMVDYLLLKSMYFGTWDPKEMIRGEYRPNKTELCDQFEIVVRDFLDLEDFTDSFYGVEIVDIKPNFTEARKRDVVEIRYIITTKEEYTAAGLTELLKHEDMFVKCYRYVKEVVPDEPC